MASAYAIEQPPSLCEEKLEEAIWASFARTLRTAVARKTRWNNMMEEWRCVAK
jgi:hypothetical protein